ncbi:MAG: TraR/DksA family transcriptional regulator [Pseudomonadota bacterium]|nr:TraR/DksA family transcriptional regulator [Pseudomonadota bacterium]
MPGITKEVVARCREKLIKTREEIINRFQSTRIDLYAGDDKGGDEADQTVRTMAESETLSMHERLRQKLYEIELALARIEGGTFGMCEETEEPIEADRLLAIPWTRLSIEGAEIRESLKKRYAR